MDFPDICKKSNGDTLAHLLEKLWPTTLVVMKIVQGTKSGVEGFQASKNTEWYKSGHFKCIFRGVNGILKKTGQSFPTSLVKIEPPHHNDE